MGYRDAGNRGVEEQEGIARSSTSSMLAATLGDDGMQWERTRDKAASFCMALAHMDVELGLCIRGWTFAHWPVTAISP